MHQAKRRRSRYRSTRSLDRKSRRTTLRQVRSRVTVSGSGSAGVRVWGRVWGRVRLRVNEGKESGYCDGKGLVFGLGLGQDREQHKCTVRCGDAGRVVNIRAQIPAHSRGMEVNLILHLNPWRATFSKALGTSGSSVSSA